MEKCQPSSITNKRCARIIRTAGGRIRGCQGYVKRVISLGSRPVTCCLYDRLPSLQEPLGGAPKGGGN